MGRAVLRRDGKRANERLAEAKLQLAEFLLLSDNPAECARNAVSWMITYPRARHALCAAVDPARSRLVGLAADGYRMSAPGAFDVDMEESPHPLVSALRRTQPTILRVSDRE